MFLLIDLHVSYARIHGFLLCFTVSNPFSDRSHWIYQYSNMALRLLGENFCLSIPKRGLDTKKNTIKYRNLS